MLAAAAAWRVAASFAVRRGARVWPVVLAVAWSSSVWLRLVVLAWRRPVYDWDGLYYHLPALQGWVQAGRVAWLDNVPDLPWANGYPGGMEVLSFVVHRLTGSSAFVDGSNLLLWPLGALGLVVLAGRLGARGPWRWLPAALGAGVPTLVVQSCTCYTDVGFAAAVTAALAAALLFVFADDLRRATRVVVLGAALGLVLATKGTGAPFAAIIGLAAVGAAAARARWRLAVAGVAVADHRPAGRRILVRAQRPPHGQPGVPDRPARWGRGNSRRAGIRPTWSIPTCRRGSWTCRRSCGRCAAGWSPGRRPAHTDPTAGLGWLWIAGGVPAALWVLGRRPGAPALLLVAMGALLLLVHPAPWWSRQTLWLHAIGLPCLALALGRMPRRSRPSASTLAFAAVAIWEGESALAGEWARGRDRRRLRQHLGRPLPLRPHGARLRPRPRRAGHRAQRMVAARARCSAAPSACPWRRGGSAT